MSDWLEIDGAFGEGGGQILRTALALSLLRRRPIHLYNIRARRERPGLRRQHLTCVLAAAEISQAEVQGAELGSREIFFRPKTLLPGEWTFDIGTAGSTTLLLQAILPPLLLAPGPSHLILRGGTHNPKAPPFEFLDRVYLPLLRWIGAKVEIRLSRYGFYPRGGGEIEVWIEPVERLRPIELLERGEVLALRAEALVADLPRHIGEREIGVLASRFPLVSKEIVEIRGEGRGNLLFLEIESAEITELFTGFGEKGVPAEKVAAHLASEVERYLKAEVPVGPYLADQLLLPLALAGGGAFRTLKPTLHTVTNIAVIEKFLPVRFGVEREGADRYRIGCR